MVDATHEVGVGVGWGGDDNILCTCTHGWCYATSCLLHLHTWSVLRNTMGWGWGGVGWGGDDSILCTCTHGRCYATSCFLHLHTWSVLRNMGWGGDDNILCTCTCTHACYATSCFLPLHTWLVLRNTTGWGGDDNILCTCTHGWCYATSCSLHLHTWSVLRNIMFLALAHMVGATQHHRVGLVLRNMGWGGDDNILCTCTHGWCYATSWGGDDNILCTCTHGWCYATSCSLHLHTWSVLRNIMFLALAHMVGATQHHVSCTCTHGRCYATPWVGVGWGGDDNILCTCTHGG